MATVKKGVVAMPRGWCKHFKPYGKRQFWHRHRGQERTALTHDRLQLLRDDPNDKEWDYENDEWLSN